MPLPWALWSGPRGQGRVRTQPGVCGAGNGSCVLHNAALPSGRGCAGCRCSVGVKVLTLLDPGRQLQFPWVSVLRWAQKGPVFPLPPTALFNPRPDRPQISLLRDGPWVPLPQRWDEGPSAPARWQLGP